MATVHSTPIGVEKAVYAILSSDTATTSTYGAVKSLAPLLNIKVSPKSSSDTLYADNRAIESVTTLGEIETELEISDLPLEVQAELLGHALDATTGIMSYRNTDNAPYIALGFKIKKANGKYRYVWLLKGKFEEVETEAKTQEDKTDFQTPKIKGTFLVRADGLWKYTADQDSGTTPATDAFLETVYKPV